MLIKIKLRYILFWGLIGFSTQTIAIGAIFPQKKNQTDSCFSDFKKEYKSLFKAIDKINRNYSDNYLHVLFLHNYDKNVKQLNIFSSILSKTDTAIEIARDKDCPNIEDIYLMRGIVLFYQQNYEEAYKIFENYNKTDFNLWLAHTAISMEDFDTAKTILQTISEELDTTNTELNKRYEMIVSDFFIKTHDYENALNHLLKIEKMPLPHNLKYEQNLLLGKFIINWEIIKKRLFIMIK